MFWRCSSQTASALNSCAGACYYHYYSYLLLVVVVVLLLLRRRSRRPCLRSPTSSRMHCLSFACVCVFQFYLNAYLFTFSFIKSSQVWAESPDSTSLIHSLICICFYPSICMHQPSQVWPRPLPALLISHRSFIHSFNLIHSCNLIHSFICKGRCAVRFPLPKGGSRAVRRIFALLRDAAGRCGAAESLQCLQCGAWIRPSPRTFFLSFFLLIRNGRIHIYLLSIHLSVSIYLSILYTYIRAPAI